MKKHTIALALAAALFTAGASSCKKSDPAPTPVTPPASTGSTPMPATGNVDGALISLKVDVSTVVGGYPITVSTDNGLATFFTATGNNASFVDGGAVSVNQNALAKQSNNSYLKSATIGQTPGDLGFDGGNSNWSVAGNGSVPAFTYSHSTAFPEFTGTLPTSISRSAPLTIALSGKVRNADSVIVFIVKDQKSVIRTFAANATSAVISAADLASLPVVSDNTALMEVIPYSVVLKAFGGKNYAFIKERAVVGNINID